MSRPRVARMLLLVLALAPAAGGSACSRGAAARQPAGFASCEGRLPDGARCTTVRVPEDSSKPAGRYIDLRVAVLPARGGAPEPDPVFVLAGGPGQPATSLMRAEVHDELRERRDLVFVDQRGTGGSNALLCEFYGPPGDPASYFGQFLPVDKVRACRERFGTAVDLTQYTTAASVADLERVRQALGYDRINLSGGSYGTRLALEYLRAHQPRVRTVMLEGPITPDVHVPENFGVHAQRALDGVLDECAATPACAASYPGIHQTAQRVFARLEEGPVTAPATYPGAGRTATVTLTRWHVAEVIRYMLYSSREAGRVPQVLHRAAAGDYAPIAAFLLNWRRNGLFDGLYLSITCTEDVPFVAADADAREAATFMAGYRLREQRAACSEWPAGPKPAWLGVAVTVDTPVLILSGALDPATPPANGDALARSLPRSLHIVVPHGGHSPAGLLGLECLQRIEKTFVETGDVKGIDTSCVRGIRRPPFAAPGS